MKKALNKILLFCLTIMFCFSMCGLVACSEQPHTHSWNDGELTTAPTQTTQGLITYTCLSCDETKSEVVAPGTQITTRADVEEALVNVAWAYYMKGAKSQYDSVDLAKVGHTYGGNSRHTRYVSPEYGTEDTSIYMVCSSFAREVYWEAINRHLFEQKLHPNGIVTRWLRLLGENQPEANFKEVSVDKKTKNDKDVAIANWVNYNLYKSAITSMYSQSTANTTMEYAEKLGTFKGASFVDWYKDGKLQLKKGGPDGYSYYLNGEYISPSEVKNLWFNYVSQKDANGKYVNLRPGDILANQGHTIVYIGNGYALDSNNDGNGSGGKYNTTTGFDNVEQFGTTASLVNVDKVFRSYADSSFTVIRMLDYYATDCDGDPSNDILKYQGEQIEVSTATQSRKKYPGIEIDRTVDITPYGTASKNEQITYSIKITNKSNDYSFSAWHAIDGINITQDYENLKITETIPNGTTFANASAGCSIENGVLTWNIDVPAGQMVEVNYTVNVVAEVGEKIINGGGMVDNIPSNVIENRVGNAKLSANQQSILSNLANSDKSEWQTKYGTGLAFAQGVYNEMGISLTLPTIEQVIQNVYTPTTLEKRTSLTAMGKDNLNPVTMFLLNKQVSAEYLSVRNMMVDNFWGGYRAYAADPEIISQGRDAVDFQNDMDFLIKDVRYENLEVGDILVYTTAQDRGDTTLSSAVASSSVLICVGNQTLIEMTSNGQANVYSEEYAKAKLVASFKKDFDLFFVMRPSQSINFVSQN